MQCQRIKLSVRSENSTERGHGDGQPVVILLGWAGCQDKYLAKYSAIYSQKNRSKASLGLKSRWE
ncbi:PREDICTED: transmembrane protein 53-like [Pygoscelis adeliae]|uniref:transmembrane protein 53-like n=1 Tax=Pygoscelis adeliae TaxID=9238 RepID=UPI0004F4EE66|nr:PREDICTED: transmembrane protein 53-like [Pygoscelis adeliae]